ncbi:MAG: glycosyltransferase [Desulfomonilia bacterium]
MNVEHPTLGVIMIVRNEEQALPGILSDVKKIADEIVIVDTGSEDDTVGVSESFGAHVEYFPWKNDFAAARNYSIECASCDYLLWLDADDRIDEKDQNSLASLKTRLSPGGDRAYMLRILNSTHDAPATVSYQTRIIPKKPGVRFEGKVHEQILPSLEASGITIESTEIVIRHTGYHDKETRLAKGKRNLEILLDEYNEGKQTATQCFFIAMASIAVGDYAQCLEYLKQAREKRSSEDWFHYSFAVATECLMRLDRFQEAYDESQRGITLFKDSSLMHYYHGLVCMKTGYFEEAASVFHSATRLSVQVSSYPIPPDIVGGIWFQYGKALEKIGRHKDAVTSYKQALDSGYNQTETHHALGLALVQVGRVEDAVVHFETARTHSDTVNAPVWMSLARVYVYTKRFADAQKVYSEILSENPSDLHALAGILETSIEIDDTKSFFSALERLVNILDIPVPEEINTVAECANLCVEVGRCLEKSHEYTLSKHLAEIALRLDGSCSPAYVLLADLATSDNDVPSAIANLEKALKSGAHPQEVVSRLSRIEQTGITER